MTLRAFSGADIPVEMAAWDDPEVDWSCFDLVALRSTWDYPSKVDRFREWIERTGQMTKLWNPPGVVLWNLDKHYLNDLTAKGVPVVPTLYTDDLEDVRWKRFVIKPTISCGSYLTRSFAASRRKEAAEFLTVLRKAHEPMIQPYLRSVDREGERSLIWIAKEFTHAIRKSPRFADDDESVSDALTPTLEELEVAARAIWAAPGPLLYARVDLMRGDDGKLLVSELELIEPSLFFVQHPPALERFVTAARKVARLA